jgi:hypothetical protein
MRIPAHSVPVCARVFEGEDELHETAERKRCFIRKIRGVA